MPSDAAMKVWREAQAAYAEGADTAEAKLLRAIFGDEEASQKAAAVIDRAIADAVEQERARVARALRLYPEWCRNWGMDHNMNIAIQAANECADMLATLPAELPEDDDEAASAIFKTLPWWIEANARANTPRGDHKERQENGNDRQ